MKKERIEYIDLGAGLMILWMIIGHAVGAASCMEITLNNLWDVTDASLIPEGIHAYIDYDGKIHGMGLPNFIPNIFFFFMPWFFYKSGQFFSKRGVADEWKKDWNKLILQFLIWSAIGYVLYVVFRLKEGGFTFHYATYSTIRAFFLNGHIELNVPLWFLFSLFIVRQVANILLPQENDKYYWLKCIIIIIVGYGIAFGAYCLKFRLLPLWVANCSTGLAYFTLGYCLRKYETEKWLMVPCVLVYLTCCIWGFPFVGMRSNSCSSAIVYLLSLPGCCAGIVTFNMFCRHISKHLHLLSLPFEYVGKYAMIIYVSHGILYISISNILNVWNLTNLMPYTFWIIVGSYIIFLPIFCYLYSKQYRSSKISE